MSYIRFFHACTEWEEVAVYVGGMPVTRQLAYGESTPHFLMGSGQTLIRIEEKGQVRMQHHVIIPRDQAFTIALVCRGGIPEIVPIAEDGKAASGGMSGVRVVCLSENDQTLELWRRARQQEELLFSEVQQGDVSEYVQLEAGEHRWELREAGATISMLPGQQTADTKLHSLYLIGRGDPDEEQRPLVLRMMQDVTMA
ncbi:MAG: DUF4397 domain-containing protein [Lachnospiraceae bacterium]|jgi:hypothetical protein|nr:DUF4397 domain-containing protein [Lachnospiraceae bacterium]